MWPSNALTERLNLRWPILQAPMGSASTPALAAAVTNAGGLGGLGMWGRSAEQAARRIAGFRQQSGGSLNVNYPIWPDPSCAPEVSEAMRRHLQVHYDSYGLGSVPQPQGEVSAVGSEHLALLLETRPEVVSFHFGLPAPEAVAAIRAAGSFIISSATTVAEARLLEQQGVDAIIAQGTEAGGHRATFTGVDVSMQPGLFSLLPQIVDAVGVPVIAAGGIADGRTAAAALMLGASAVQVGTAFLHCQEAEVRDAHRAALAEADDACTIVTDIISGRPCRYIRNRMIDDLLASGLKPLPVPAQQSLTAPLGGSGRRDWTALTSGQSAALARDTGAAELVERLARETGRRLRAFA
ncbi:MAG TPA: nitronate monooxygenase family protein [Stellaceae bacterium]|nr:nitronate monooxygenase family protein [Stellaceae bacterium]